MSITDMSVTREQRRQLMRDNAKQPEILTPVPESEWPPCELRNRPTDVWRSRHYLVQAYSSTGGVTRLSIDRTTMQADGRWEAGLSWDELQEIKRQVGFGNCFAVECFPKDKDIVNVANMRHLWVLPKPLEFAWSR